MVTATHSVVYIRHSSVYRKFRVETNTEGTREKKIVSNNLRLGHARVLRNIESVIRLTEMLRCNFADVLINSIFVVTRRQRCKSSTGSDTSFILRERCIAYLRNCCDNI